MSKVIQVVTILAVLVFALIAGIASRHLAVFMHENYGIELRYVYVTTAAITVIIAWELAKLRERKFDTVLDSPDVMEILYQPLTRIVHCRDDDPQSKVSYHHTEIFECNYELVIPIGTIVCEGHFNYQITGYNPFCNGKGRVYRTKRL